MIFHVLLVNSITIYVHGVSIWGELALGFEQAWPFKVGKFWPHGQGYPNKLTWSSRHSCFWPNGAKNSRRRGVERTGLAYFLNFWQAWSSSLKVWDLAPQILPDAHRWALQCAEADCVSPLPTLLFPRYVHFRITIFTDMQFHEKWREGSWAPFWRLLAKATNYQARSSDGHRYWPLLFLKRF